MPTCHILRLGRVPYRDALALQLRIVELVGAARARHAVLLLLEHDPVITRTRRVKDAHLRVTVEELAALGVEVVDTDRGGDITYHGPGQIVGYPILFFPGEKLDIHRYIRRLEAVVISALASFNVQGQRLPGYSGVWVGEAKVAAIGVRFRSFTSHHGFRSYVSYHGFALNVSTDLSAFNLIVPCGIADKPVTSLEKLLGCAPPRAAVEDVLIAAFCREFELPKPREFPSPDELLATLCAGSRPSLQAPAG